jgi:hypothetical protein
MNKPFLCGVLAASLFAVNTLPSVSAQDAAVVAAPTDVYDGKLKPLQGEKYKLRFFVRSATLQTLSNSAHEKEIGFKKVESVSIIKFNADYDIVSVDSFGNHQARVTYGDFLIDIDTKIDGEAPSPAVKTVIKKTSNEFLKAIKGASFLIKMSPTSQVYSVYGLEALRARLTNRLAELSPQTRSGTEAMLSNILSEQNIKNSFGNLTGQLPSQPIRVSESWKYSTPATSGALPIPAIEGVRTLVSLTSGIATIKDVGSFTLTSPASELSPPMDVSGSQTVVTRIRNVSGMPLDATATQTMEGIVGVSIAQNKQPIDVKISAVNNSRVVVERK